MRATRLFLGYIEANEQSHASALLRASLTPIEPKTVRSGVSDCGRRPVYRGHALLPVDYNKPLNSVVLVLLNLNNRTEKVRARIFVCVDYIVEQCETAVFLPIVIALIDGYLILTFIIEHLLYQSFVLCPHKQPLFRLRASVERAPRIFH